MRRDASPTNLCLPLPRAHPQSFAETFGTDFPNAALYGTNRYWFGWI